MEESLNPPGLIKAFIKTEFKARRKFQIRLSGDFFLERSGFFIQGLEYVFNLGVAAHYNIGAGIFEIGRDADFRDGNFSGVQKICMAEMAALESFRKDMADLLSHAQLALGRSFFVDVLFHDDKYMPLKEKVSFM